MNGSRTHWRKRLFNQTPRFVTLAGYIFGLGIFAAAGSTWFINTDQSSPGTAILSPATRTILADRDSVVMDGGRRLGGFVNQGEDLCRTIDDPESVANYRLASDLRNRLAEFEQLPSPAAKTRAESLRVLLGAIPASQQVLAIKSPVQGWVVASVLASDSHADRKAKELTRSAPRVVPKGTAIFSIAAMDRLTAEVSTSCNRPPSIQPGEKVSLLLADWDPHDTPFRLVGLTATAVVEIPRSEFKDQALERLRQAKPLRITLWDREAVAEAAIGKETIRLSIKADNLPAAVQDRIKANGPVTIGFPDLEHQRARTKWEPLPCVINLEIEGGAVSSLVRQALTEQLSQGNATLVISRCWVKVGTQRLFLRLFGK